MTIQLQAPPDLTCEQLAELNEEAREQGRGRGYELDEGELILMTALNPSDGRLQLEFGRQLANYVSDRGLGEVFMDSFTDLGRRRWYYPDYVYLSHSDLQRFDGRSLPLPSTLFVECSTESSRRRDRGRKRAVYHEAGVPWYWIIDFVDDCIEEYRWRPDTYELVKRVGLYEPFSPELFPDLMIQLRPLIPPAPRSHTP